MTVTINREDAVARFYSATDNFDRNIKDPANKPHLVRAMALIREEMNEMDEQIIRIVTKHSYNKEVPDDIVEHLIKELADLCYVVSGFAVEFGIDLDAAFELVSRSNLTKLDENGAPLEVADNGKIKKGPNYVAPDMTGVYYAGKLHRDSQAV